MQEPDARSQKDRGITVRSQLIEIRALLVPCFLWFVLQNIFDSRSQVGQAGQRASKGKGKAGQGHGALMSKRVELRK